MSNTVPNALTNAVDAAVSTLRGAYNDLENCLTLPGQYYGAAIESSLSSALTAARTKYDAAYNALQAAITAAGSQPGYNMPKMPSYGDRL